MKHTRICLIIKYALFTSVRVRYGPDSMLLTHTQPHMARTGMPGAGRIRDKTHSQSIAFACISITLWDHDALQFINTNAIPRTLDSGRQRAQPTTIRSHLPTYPIIIIIRAEVNIS